MLKAHIFEPIVDILVESASRNSLLNSAVLEFLQYVAKVFTISRTPNGAGSEKGNYHSYCGDVWRTIQTDRDIWCC